jgi:hypothetical protein
MVCPISIRRSRAPMRCAWSRDDSEAEKLAILKRFLAQR